MSYDLKNIFFDCKGEDFFGGMKGGGIDRLHIYLGRTIEYKYYSKAHSLH